MYDRLSDESLSASISILKYAGENRSLEHSWTHTEDVGAIYNNMLPLHILLKQPIEYCAVLN